MGSKPINAFVLTIGQNGKTKRTGNIKGDSGGIEMPAKFAAGEYYIRVKPSSARLAEVYTLSLE